MKRFCLLLIGFCFLPLMAASSQAPSSNTSSFSVKINGEPMPFRVFSRFLLPGEALTIDVGGIDGALPVKLETSGGAQVPTSATQWRWTAPRAAGLYPLKVERADTHENVVVNAFVMRPYSELKGEFLNGYHIGKYPKPFGKTYQLPRGFIEVTAANENTFVSPHFRLKQFLCKQSGGFPKYLVLREPLLKKLEMTIAAVNQDGYQYQSFHVMSGYRTPYYNRSLGNVKFSRHMLGEAADILMDGSESRTITASSFFKLVDQAQRRFGRGGLGKYSSNGHHGPFVHVDVRDYLARWEG